MSPFIEPLIGPLIIEPGIKSMEKKYQKTIRTVIAPEHKHKHKDIENELKGEEKY